LAFTKCFVANSRKVILEDGIRDELLKIGGILNSFSKELMSESLSDNVLQLLPLDDTDSEASSQPV
jgi:hypothetical protein